MAVSERAVDATHAGNARSPRRVVGRALSYARALGTGARPGYIVASFGAHVLPDFSFGPIIARLYRLAGVRVGQGSSFMGPVRLLGGGRRATNLVLGRGVVIGSEVTINLDGPVTIGDGASIGPFARIYTATHAIGPGSRRMTPTASGRPVVIGRGAWIGLGSIVLPGVTIGDGCVVGAGSVVTVDVEPHTYVEGNPARVVRSLPWRDR
jgi:maltose O-acetyltransferase